MPTCSVVIRAFNEEKHLGKLLSGLKCQTIQPSQVILIDSGSTDTTVEIAKKEGVQVVSIRPEDFSFGRSLNLGISKATSEYIVICSAHVYPVYPDWLEKLLEPFADLKIALTYGKQRGADTSHFAEQQIFLHWYPEQTDLHQSHPFCNNANAAIRKPLWDVHPYHEDLPALEDLEWAKWAHDQGLGIAYVKDAEVIHVHNETWDGVLNRYRREGMAFKHIYPNENFYLWDMFHSWFQNVFSDFHAASTSHKMAGNLRNIIRFRWMQSLGTYRGYHQSGPLTWQLKKAFYYPRPNLHAEMHTNDRKVKPIDYASR
jgi:glycosyltransferase involved in cell wall biosynthesis